MLMPTNSLVGRGGSKMKVLRKKTESQEDEALINALRAFLRRNAGSSRNELGVYLGSCLRFVVGVEAHPQELMGNNLRAWEAGFKTGLEGL
jgi:hypothetical protein